METSVIVFHIQGSKGESLCNHPFTQFFLMSGFTRQIPPSDTLLLQTRVAVSKVQKLFLLQLSEWKQWSGSQLSYPISLKKKKKNRLLMQNGAGFTAFPSRPPWWHILPLINSMRRWGSGRWPLCWLIKLAYALLTYEKQLITCKLGLFFLNYKYSVPC